MLLFKRKQSFEPFPVTKQTCESFILNELFHGEAVFHCHWVMANGLRAASLASQKQMIAGKGLHGRRPTVSSIE